ncbi:MAG: methyl-accepting chemotaxis protein, partial [Gammaproteobacteria bacterium]|nr:methyl-accepting chemotaxis protein [Gammaproteobacteria bacterium]
MNSFRNLSLKWKLGIGFGLPLAVFILVSGTVYINLTGLTESSRWVTHTHKAISRGNKVAGAMVNMETGLRGFLLSGNDEFLEPLTVGKAELTSVIADLREQVSDNPRQVERLTKVEAMAKEWLTEHVKPAMEYRREVIKGENAARHFTDVSSRTIGKELFDGFRLALSEVNGSFIRSDDLQAQALVKLILLDMVNQETGQRGFLLTGQQASLDPYTNGIDELEKHALALRSHIGRAYNREAVRESIQEISSIMATWTNEVAMVGIKLKKGVGSGKVANSAVIDFVNRGLGKKHFDRTRQHVDSIQAGFEKSEDTLALGLVGTMSKNMVDMETGYRGFLLTGKQDSLEPFHDGKEGFNKSIEDLQNLVSRAFDPDTELKRLNKAIDLAKSWQVKAAQPEIEARRAMNQVEFQIGDVIAFIEKGIGKKYMDEIRIQVNEFIAEESALVEVRNQDQVDTSNTTILTTQIGTILALIAGSLIAFFMTRYITGSMHTGLGVAEKISQGDFSSVIEIKSNDETGQLLQSLQVMQDNLKERIEADALVAQANGRIKTALDSVGANVMLADVDMNIIY